MTAPVEIGDPRRDPAAYRRCLGQFATGVAVMTAASGDHVVGMTANSFASVSLDPPLVLWSVRRTSHSFEGFKGARHFAVNILADDQVTLSREFSRSGADKFAGVPWRLGMGGAPLIAGVAACLECRRAGDYDGGDHLILLGEVRRFTRYSRNVLLFVQGRYGVANDHPESRVPVEPAADEPAEGPMDEFLTALLWRAHGALSAALEEGRRAEGFNLIQSRILAALDSYAHQSAEWLATELYLGLNATESAAAALVAQGLVAKAADRSLSLTPRGRKRLRALLDRVRRIEAQELSAMAPEDVAGTRRVLKALIEQRRAEQGLKRP